MIHLRYIQAHKGHTGNEVADSLAKRATTHPHWYFPAPIPKSEYKTLINQKIESLWTERWPTFGLSQIYIWFPWPDHHISKKLLLPFYFY